MCVCVFCFNSFCVVVVFCFWLSGFFLFMFFFFFPPERKLMLQRAAVICCMSRQMCAFSAFKTNKAQQPNLWLWVKNRHPKRNLGKWNQGLKPAVLILVQLCLPKFMSTCKSRFDSTPSILAHGFGSSRRTDGPPTSRPRIARSREEPTSRPDSAFFSAHVRNGASGLQITSETPKNRGLQVKKTTIFRLVSWLMLLSHLLRMPIFCAAHAGSGAPGPRMLAAHRPKLGPR